MTMMTAEEIFARCNMRKVLNDADKKPEWIIQGLIERGEQWIISGAPKTGKSRLALQLAVAASLNSECIGFKANGHQKVLYMDMEMSERSCGSRALRLHGNDREKMSNNANLFICKDFMNINVLNSDDLAKVTPYINTIKPDLIVWDVLTRCHIAKENDNGEMAQVMLAFRKLCAGVAHIVVHHDKKPQFQGGAMGAGAMRGASAIHGEVNGVLSIVRPNEAKNDYRLSLSGRDVNLPERMHLVGNGDLSFSAVLPPQKVSIESKLSDAFGAEDTLTKTVLIDALKGSQSIKTAERLLKEGVEKGLLTSQRVGKAVEYTYLKSNQVCAV